MEAFPGFGDDFFFVHELKALRAQSEKKNLQANYPVSLRTMAISPSLGVLVTNTAQQSSY